ncbi:hypothetical protein GIB67_007007 [Kingdonia uniflora]|uniref:Uncharacterized protein n=1 Tax=Kingdonia uniflora TaxID=39325 RepID=A0A7J7NZY6_9MAGN|nr:hypothetical protein GIB67_007007 [Kingdonia uniflora]
MINTKNLMKTARKLYEVVVISRGRTVLSRTDDIVGDKQNKLVVDKGHVALYTADENQVVVPLPYLKHDIFKEFLRVSEEEFGLPKDGPITLPSDMVFMKYNVSLVESRVSKKVEKALLASISSGQFIIFLLQSAVTSSGFLSVFDSNITLTFLLLYHNIQIIVSLVLVSYIVFSDIISITVIPINYIRFVLFMFLG